MQFQNYNKKNFRVIYQNLRYFKFEYVCSDGFSFFQN